MFLNMAEYIKKNKACNFSVKEISRLNELVAKYSAVLFNQKTDSGTNKQKVKVWESIEAEFNCNMPGPIPRSASQLKFKFGNLKRLANAEWSKVVEEQRKSGVNVQRPSDVSETTLQLEGVMETSIVSEAPTSDCNGYPAMSSDPTIELIDLYEAKAELLRSEQKLDMMKRRAVQEAELQHFLLRKTIADCRTAELQRQTAELQQKTAEAQKRTAEAKLLMEDLIKKKKDK